MKHRTLFSRPWLLWMLCCFGFVILLYFGYYNEQDEQVFFIEYAPKLFQNLQRSLFLVVPSVFATAGFVAVLFLIRFQLRYSKKYFLTIIDSLPTIFSAIPLFITAIIFIRYLKLDTLYSYNYFYGVLCLSLFNIGYLYHKLKKCLTNEYRKPYVTYARSLGVPKQDIFRHYVLPGVIPHIFATLRELFPHIVVESIVIEYTFSYNALLRSAVQALQYNNWHYLILFFYIVILCISFFEIICRSIEKRYQGSVDI